MYLIVDKASHAILHMSNAYPGQERQPQDLLPGFDPATMDFGRSPESHVPLRFAIEDGVVKDLDAAAPAAAPPETLAAARERKLHEFSTLSLALRAQLIPDFQLLNAGLGLYDPAWVQALRSTVQAFRDEYHRLEQAVAKAKTIKALEALQPSYPAAVQPPKTEVAP